MPAIAADDRAAGGATELDNLRAGEERSVAGHAVVELRAAADLRAIVDAFEEPVGEISLPPLRII